MRIVYIDGASLEGELEAIRSVLGIDELPFLYDVFINRLGAERAYYYDAWPEMKASETASEFEKRRNDKQALFSRLNRIPKLHVKTGTTRWSKRQGQRQKAVDVLLAVDVVTHALRGISDDAVVVASDLDFYPVFETLLNTQVTTRLVFRPQHIADELIKVADSAMALTKTFLMNCCNGNFAAKFHPVDFPTSGELTEDEKSMAATTKFGDQDLAIWKNSDGKHVSWFQDQRCASPIRELALERWGMDGLTKLTFSDGSVYP